MVKIENKKDKIAAKERERLSKKYTDKRISKKKKEKSMKKKMGSVTQEEKG